MKCTLVLSLLYIATSAALVPPQNAVQHVAGQRPFATGPLAIPAPPPAPTLTQDLEELLLLVPSAPLQQLFMRYLLNDAQFQAFTRVINSQDAFLARMRMRSQPEVIAFSSWVRLQMMLSGGSLESESEEVMTLLNPTPYWANTVYGWQGFISEFLAYYPTDLIRAHIDAKAMQNGIFAQFWARLKALKPVYERVIAFPETQRVITQLKAEGIDTQQLDQLIRNQFGWVNLPPQPAAPAPAASAPQPAAPVSPVA